MRFKEIKTSDGLLATYSLGEGPPLVFLHGSPGDTHHYLREVAVTLKDRFRCILYDQRGTGRSFLKVKGVETLNLRRFIQDLDDVLSAYDLDKASLLGHSWGSILGLFYACARPQRVTWAALVSMGPLTPHFVQQNHKNMLRGFTPDERRQWEQWREARSTALQEGDSALLQHMDNLMMGLRVKSWVAKPGLRQAFLDSYFADPAIDRMVNKLVWSSLPEEFDFEELKRVHVPTWLCQGDLDPNPLEQAQLLVTHLPKVQLSILENCGHIPWLDASADFYKGIDSSFSTSRTSLSNSQ